MKACVIYGAAKGRAILPESPIPPITTLNNEQLQHWLCRCHLFAPEVRKVNGQSTSAAPATLAYHIVSGMRLFEAEWQAARPLPGLMLS